MNVQEITITKNGPVKGSNSIRWNFDLNGVPFGQVWTFRRRGEVHPFHAKPLNGEHKLFASFEGAERYMRSQM